MSEAKSKAAERGPPPASQHLLLFACALLVLGYAVILAMAWSGGAWLVGPGGRPAPADFNGLWAAARLSASGHAAEAYTWSAAEHVLAQAGRAPRGYLQFPFFYPPVFLLWLKPLGALSYPAAAPLWVIVSLAGYLGGVVTVRRTALALVSALAAPAVLACLFVGQNGLLTAALAAVGLALPPTRPLVAGVFIGLIAYKPQFGLALPILLAAGGRWRSFAAAAATVAVTWLAAGLVLGVEVYPAWLHQLLPGPGEPPALGALSPEKVQSVYGLVRAAGAGSEAAWSVHAFGAALAVGLAAWLWRKPSPWPLQAAAACAVMLIASPYSVLYDFPLLSVAICFLLRDGERAPLTTAEGGALVLAFIAPFAAAALVWPLCPVGAGLALTVAVRRAAGITKVSSGPRHPKAVPLASS